MDEQTLEKFDQWAYANLGKFTNSDKHAVAWEAWQACAAALSQPAAAQGDSSHSAGGECGGVQVPLTEEQAVKIGLNSGFRGIPSTFVRFARVIEASHGIKATPWPAAAQESNALRVDHPLAQGKCVHGAAMSANCPACGKAAP